jgi:pentose-5-phosphate-3-epimerase
MGFAGAGSLTFHFEAARDIRALIDAIHDGGMRACIAIKPATVIWGIEGFDVVDLMTEQHNYNTYYFFSHMIECVLCAIFADGRKLRSRRHRVHLDHSKAANAFSPKVTLFECAIRPIVMS